jgi:hypothetical protein
VIVLGAVVVVAPANGEEALLIWAEPRSALTASTKPISKIRYRETNPGTDDSKRYLISPRQGISLSDEDIVRNLMTLSIRNSYASTKDIDE